MLLWKFNVIFIWIKRKNNGLVKVITGIRRCGKSYLLLDEVQMLDCFETVLNGYLRKENMDVYVTGSNAKFLSSDIITEFAGRGDEIHMYPLSFSEFMSFYPGDKYEGLSQYMLYGGIPMVVLKDEDADKAATLNNLFDEIYIQSAYSIPDAGKREQEIRPFRKIVVTQDIVPYHYDEHGILIMNIYDFLLEPSKLDN